MPPKKKREVAKEPGVGAPPETSEQTGAEKEVLLRREYDELTDTLNHLKRRFEQLRCENESLQKEVDQTRTETQEYVDYMSKRAQERQNAIVALSDQNHQELERLRREREEAEKKNNERANEIKREILKKKNKLSLVQAEIGDHGEFKNLLQLQLGHITKLQQEETSLRCSQSKRLDALKADFFCAKERYERRAQDEVKAVAFTANREASRCLASQTWQVVLENQRMRDQLQQLIQRVHARRSRRDQLQARRQQLLLEESAWKPQRQSPST